MSSRFRTEFESAKNETADGIGEYVNYDGKLVHRIHVP